MSISFRILKILSSVSKKISLKSEPINLINILILIMYCNIRIHEDQYLLFGLIGHRNMTSAFERLSWNFNAVPVIFLATSRTGYFVTKISLTQSIHFCSTFLKNFCLLLTRKLYTKGKNDVLACSFIFISSTNKLGTMDLLISFRWKCSFSPLFKYIVIVRFASVAIAFKCSPPTALSTIEHISIVVIL